MVAEHGTRPPPDVDAPMPQLAEQLLEVPKIVPQDRILQQTVEQVASDHEASVKVFAEELKAWTEATQVLQSETDGADGHTYSLFQEISSAALQTPTDLKGFDMMTVVRRLAEQEHFAALAQLRSRISAITKFGADADNDPFVKEKDLIMDFSRLQAEASSETSQKFHCDEEASKATEMKEDLGAEVSKHSPELLSVVYKNAVDSRRAAWRVITSIEQKEKSKSEEQLASYAREYMLQKIREGVLALTDKKLIPLPSTDESEAFYYKMKSDYHRYLAKFATGETKRKIVEELAEISQVFSLDGVQQGSVEQIIETPAISLAGKILEMPVTRKTQQVANTHVQHVVNAVEVKKHVVQEKINQETKQIEIPPLQFIDKAMDIPVVAQRQVPQVQSRGEDS